MRHAATLPRGWDQRTVAVSNAATRGTTGYCLEAHDLAASKLVAGREKDRIFAATLLMEELVDSETLLQRVAALPIEAERSESIARWIRVIVEDIA